MHALFVVHLWYICGTFVVHFIIKISPKEQAGEGLIFIRTGQHMLALLEAGSVSPFLCVQYSAVA